MEVILARRDQCADVIAVRGDIDLSNATVFLHRLLALIGSTKEPIMLDLSQVTFMDCAGLRTLATLGDLVRGTGGSVHVVSLSAPVARLFDLVAIPRGKPQIPAARVLADFVRAAAPDRRPWALAQTG